MKKYRVELKFKHSDTVHVEAESREEAQELTLEECHEEFECFYDSEINEESDDDIE